MFLQQTHCWPSPLLELPLLPDELLPLDPLLPLPLLELPVPLPLFEVEPEPPLLPPPRAATTSAASAASTSLHSCGNKWDEH